MVCSPWTTLGKSHGDNTVNFGRNEGRQYHAYYGVDKNPLPTDQVEQERFVHHHHYYYYYY